MSDNPEYRAEWRNLCACSCDFGLSLLCIKCNESRATCECAYQSWVVNTKQRAWNTPDDEVAPRDLAFSLRAMYERARATTIKRAVTKLETHFTQHAAGAVSAFYLNLATDLGELGDVTINEVLETFFAKHPTLRPCCTVSDNMFRVNLIQ